MSFFFLSLSVSIVARSRHASCMPSDCRAKWLSLFISLMIQSHFDSYGHACYRLRLPINRSASEQLSETHLIQLHSSSRNSCSISSGDTSSSPFSWIHCVFSIAFLVPLNSFSLISHESTCDALTTRHYTSDFSFFFLLSWDSCTHHHTKHFMRIVDETPKSPPSTAKRVRHSSLSLSLAHMIIMTYISSVIQSHSKNERMHLM